MSGRRGAATLDSVWDRLFGRVGERLVPLAAALSFLGGCQNYTGQLDRAQDYYEDSRYEQALAVFRHLDADVSRLNARETVRYYYLRGMTDLRLGFKTESRYYLGLASAALREDQTALTAEESRRLGDSLSDLNREHFAQLPGAKTGAIASASRCEWSSECAEGFVCRAGMCRAL